MHRYYLACLCVFLSFALPSVARCADPVPADDGGSVQAYFDRLLGGAFYEKRSDFLLGKVVRFVEPAPKDFTAGYEIEVAGSYRGELRERSRIIVGGDQDPPVLSDFGSMPKLPVGATVLIAVDPTGRAGEYAYKGRRATPFGVTAPHTVEVPDVGHVNQALAEMRKVVPPDGKGPVNHDEAERLLESKDRLMWALGATLLACEGTPKDVHQLMLIFNSDENLTLQQALWVHDLVTWVVKEHAQPLKSDADEALIGFLKRYSVAHVNGLEAASEKIK